MFGLIKKLLIALVLLIIIGLVVVYFSINSIVGSGVEKAFNKFGPEVTGTETYIKGANINVFGGDIGIDGLFIGNPKGFDKPSAMECSEIYVDIEPSTIFSDRIVINEIRIVAPSFTYDQNLTGNNLSKLKQQIDENTAKYKKADEPGEQPAEAPAEEQPQKTLVLHKLTVSDGKVDLAVNLAVVKTGREFPLPTIDKDFGGEGVTPAEAVDYVLSIVLEQVVKASAELVREVSNDPSALIESVTGGDGAEAGDSVKKAADAVKDLF